MNQRRSRNHSSSLERLEGRLCLSVGFISNNTSTGRITPELAADMDGDGDQDLVGRLEWQENVDGQLGPRHTFERGLGFWDIRSVSVFDVEADGDLDVVTFFWTEDREGWSWYENRGDGTLAGRRPITDRESRFGSVDVAVEDFNGDGDLDLAFLRCHDGRCSLELFRNDGHGNFRAAPLRNYSLESDRPYIRKTWTIDVDSDGDFDIVFDRHGWLENDGRAHFELRRNLVEDLPIVYAGDLNQDGRDDLVVRRMSGRLSTGIAVYLQDAAHQYNLFAEIPSVYHDTPLVKVGDADGDGDRDLFMLEIEGGGAIVTALTWFPQEQDGFGSGGGIRGSSSASFDEFVLFDLDSDGDTDVIENGKIYSSIEGNYEVVNPTSHGARGSFDTIADIDGDGDLDVISSSYSDRDSCRYRGICGRRMFWQRNLGGGVFELPQQPILASDEVTFVETLIASDVDGDGDLDLVYKLNGYGGRSIVWIEHLDGKGMFAPTERTVTPLLPMSELVDVADLDGDGRADIVVATRDALSIYRADPVGGFHDEEILLQDGGELFAILFNDRDGDGDLDLIASRFRTASQVGGRDAFEVVWLENEGSDSIFSEMPRVILSDTEFVSFRNHRRHDGNALRLWFTDFDGDGWEDLFVTDPDRASGTNVLYRSDETGAWQGERFLDPYRVLHVADFDLDGDADVVASQRNQFVLNNLGGQEFAAFQLPQRLPSSVQYFDADQDGDVDIFPFSTTHWWEARPIGDVNDDGVFDSSDLVRVMQAGGYNDQLVANSVFETGDWNGDLEFNSADLVSAFSIGHYAD